VLLWLLCLFPSDRACDGPGRDDLLLCRSCGHEVALDSDASFVASRLALSHRNITMIGDRRVPVQLFENPQGFQFEVVTFRKADVHKHWPADGRFTWYPGYSWTVATCPQCSAHLWAFQPSDWPETVTEQQFDDSKQTFVALVIDRLLQENFAATLLVTPKSF
uniref:Si:ch211-51h9.7 n=1 Tax=Paramormyrops kingsleyae TaxID=1676925 RepID=A0A3B3QPP9_9TELE